MVTQDGQGTSSAPGAAGYSGPTIPVMGQSSERPTVGLECIQETKDNMGKVTNYRCDLCNCDMNNVYMRDEHLKGNT